MNFSPASSIFFPPAAILMRDSVSGTWLMHTTEFKWRPPEMGRHSSTGTHFANLGNTASFPLSKTNTEERDGDVEQARGGRQFSARKASVSTLHGLQAHPR